MMFRVNTGDRTKGMFFSNFYLGFTLLNHGHTAPNALRNYICLHLQNNWR
jgi:hypothetical protein